MSSVFIFYGCILIDVYYAMGLMPSIANFVSKGSFLTILKAMMLEAEPFLFYLANAIMIEWNT